jgi:hypothetical protein
MCGARRPSWSWYHLPASQRGLLVVFTVVVVVVVVSRVPLHLIVALMSHVVVV